MMGMRSTMDSLLSTSVQFVFINCQCDESINMMTVIGVCVCNFCS